MGDDDHDRSANGGETADEPAPPARRRRRWKRWVLWGALAVVVIVLATAGGFYWWFESQVSASNRRVDPEIVKALKENTSTTAPTGVTARTPSTLPESPSSMNLVLVGYDKRGAGSAEKTEGRSDSIILVHVDPDRGFLSILSVPRDMLADIPGYGLYKLNASFAFGGGALLIRTIQSELGLDLDHYIALDLEAFKAVTNALGGVYMDVDRHYLNVDKSWEHIDLQAGYQLLNGADALDYVRFRHDNNIDFGRMARQQQFITAVREQALGWNLTFKIPTLVKALFQNLDTDLSANDLIKLAYWVMKLDGGRIKQAEIKAKTGFIHGIFYVLPTDDELSAAARDFYTPPGQTGATTTGGTSSPSTTAPAATGPPVAATLTPGSLQGVKLKVVNAGGRAGQGAIAALWLDRQGATILEVTTAGDPQAKAEVKYPAGRSRAAEDVAKSLGVTQVTEDENVNDVTVVLGSSYLLSAAQGAPAAPAAGAPLTVADAEEWRLLQTTVVFKVKAPTYIPYGFKYSFRRAYHIIPNDKGKIAVRAGFQHSGEDQYLGVSASDWVDAPLASPGAKVQGDGTIYTVVGSSTKVDHVWWVKNGVMYWVSNTLFADLDREQLLAVAMSMVDAPAATAAK
jgi:LCP family protein required for cell wall assembly